MNTYRVLLEALGMGVIIAISGAPVWAVLAAYILGGVSGAPRRIANRPIRAVDTREPST